MLTRLECLLSNIIQNESLEKILFAQVFQFNASAAHEIQTNRHTAKPVGLAHLMPPFIFMGPILQGPHSDNLSPHSPGQSLCERS